MLGDGDAIDRGGNGFDRAAVGVIGFGIEGVQLARASVHPKQDRGAGRGVFLRIGGGCGIVEEAGDAHAGRATQGDSEEFAAGEIAVNVGTHITSDYGMLG